MLQMFITIMTPGCNTQHRWLDISITNMNTSTGPVQVFQTCMRVVASSTDMTAG